MEGIAPTLKLILNLRYSIEKGDSIKVGIYQHIRKESDDFSCTVAAWIAAKDHGRDTNEFINLESSPIRKGVLLLLDRGLRGEPIYQNLVSLEEEAIEMCKTEVDNYLAVLPLKLLMPLLFFQFPAFLLLLFGPMLRNFLQQIS